MNKQGKILVMWWFLVLGIVSVAIVSMVNIFYSSQYDVREIEAELLAEKVATCLVQGGKLQEFAFSDLSEEEIISNCIVYFGEEQDEYFFQIDIYDSSSCSIADEVCRDSVKSFIVGNPALLSSCELAKTAEGDFPVCKERWLYAISDLPPTSSIPARERSEGKANPSFFLRIQTAINKIEENR